MRRHATTKTSEAASHASDGEDRLTQKPSTARWWARKRLSKVVSGFSTGLARLVTATVAPLHDEFPTTADF